MAEDERAYQRQKRAYRFLFPLAKAAMGLLLNYRATPAPKTEGPCLILSNHATDYDPILVGLSFPQHMYYVAGENVMRMGFLSGTDDYMVKPINVNEMVLRVGALLRRAQMINERRQTIGNTVLEYDSFTVISEDERTVLPQKEFMLLYKMASVPGKIFTRQQLMDDIWGYGSESDTHTVDVHIGRLRERFRDNEDFKIVTMRGVGYQVVKA